MSQFNAPFILELDPGTHFWCSCKLSQNQPFCDGAHKGSGQAPVVLKLDEPKKVALCGCKATGNPPYCDGSHASM